MVVPNRISCQKGCSMVSNKPYTEDRDQEVYKTDRFCRAVLQDVRRLSRAVLGYICWRECNS